MTPIEVKELRKKLKLTQSEFGKKLEVSIRTVQDWEYGKNKVSGAMELLIKSLVFSNELGEPVEPYYTNKNGNQFLKTNEGQLIITVPLIPLEAHAKYLDEITSDARVFVEFEKITFPADHIGKGNYMGFRVQGDSMNGSRIDDTPDKALILGRELCKQHWQDGFNPSQLGWVIVTHTNILFKDIVGYIPETGCIICHSRNPSPEYTDFQICLNEVHQIFKVIKRTF
jgi:transcriptional regulator with XRE-family HTH domain